MLSEIKYLIKNNKFKIFLFFLFVIIVPLLDVQSKTNEANLVNIYLFHSKTCQHCKSEIKLLNKLEKKYKNIKVYKYEISDSNNRELLNKVTLTHKVKTSGVPFTIIGDKVFTGYSDKYSKLTFIKTIEYYSKYGYNDKTANIVNNKELPTYKVKNNQISVDKFIKEYGNYNITSKIKTNDISLETTSILTSILTELNIFNLLIIIISIYIIEKQLTYKEKILSYLLYISTYLLTNIAILLNTNQISLIIFIIYVLIIIYILLRNNKKSNKIYISIILLSITANILKQFFHNKYINIYTSIIKLNLLSALETINQYLINTAMVAIIIFLFILIILKIRIYLKWVKNKKINYQKQTK